VVATAERRGDVFVARAPRAVGNGGGLLERMRVAAGPALLGFDFPLGVPRAYADLAGIDNFATWLRRLDPRDELFAVASDVADVSVARPFFPRRIAHRSPGIKAEFYAALGLSAASAFRQCDLAHCRRGAASEVFWTLGPKAVGKATVSGWRDFIVPALGDTADRYGIWPFDGDLRDLLGRADGVIVEAYPADAYLQLGLRMGSRGTAKTSQDDRRAEAPSLLDRCRRNDVAPDRDLISEIRDGFGQSRAGEDRFDATVGLIAMIDALRRGPELPEDPSVRRVEGWMFGRHARCPDAQLDDAVTFDITTAGDGDPSWGGFVGSAPILSTTPIPEETLPTSA
jgi:hypothetical protein